MITEKVLTVEKINSGWILTIHKGGDPNEHWLDVTEDTKIIQFSDAYSCADKKKLLTRIEGLI